MLHHLVPVFPLSHFLQHHFKLFQSHQTRIITQIHHALSLLCAFEMVFPFLLPYLLNFQSTDSTTGNSLTSPAGMQPSSPLKPSSYCLFSEYFTYASIMVIFSYRFNLYLVEYWKVVNSLEAQHMNLCIPHMPRTILKM